MESLGSDFQLGESALETDREKLKQEVSVSHDESPLDFVSLGMLIIDDVYQTGQAPLSNKLGGAGTYATMGARLFRPSDPSGRTERPQKVGFVVHAGSDFPQTVKAELEAWNSSSLIVQTPDRLTTRGKNVYHGEVRDFAFLNPKIQVEASMLSPAMLTSKTYHLICTPSRCTNLVTDILTKRTKIFEDYPKSQAKSSKPTFVWEPMEGSCRPEELPSFYKALKVVDVFSPNEHELDLLFNGSSIDESGLMSKEHLHNHCRQLLDCGSKDSPLAIVVRRGASGCAITTCDRFGSLPAYHTPPTEATAEELAEWHDHRSKNWDVTGGGNAFLGGFCIGLLSRPGNEVDGHGFTEFEYAAIYGSVAASFAIEQVGMPKLSYRQEDGLEMWNGDLVDDRLDKMMEICASLSPPPKPFEERISKVSPSR